MKKTYKIILALLICSNTFSAYAENITSKISKTYSSKVKDYTQVEIVNTYGDTEFITWEKDSLKVEIEVKIESRDEQNIQKAKDHLSFDYNESSSLIRCATKWTGSALSMGYLSDKLSPSYKHLIVNYKVYLPSNLELSVKSRFGNVYLESYDGRFTAEIAHGDLRFRDLTNIRNIELKYGKLKANHIHDARIKLVGVKYAEIKKANKLDLTSSMSELEIGEVDELRLESKNDEIKIEEVKICKGNTSLTDIKIQHLSTNISLQLRMGSISVRDVKPSVRDINMESSRTDVNLSFNSGTVARINLEVDAKKYMAYGLSFKEVSETVGTQEKIRSTLTYGRGEAKTSVKVYSSKGYIDLSTN